MSSEHTKRILMVKSPSSLRSAAHGASLESGEILDGPSDPSSCLLIFCRIPLHPRKAFSYYQAFDFYHNLSFPSKSYSWHDTHSTWHSQGLLVSFFDSWEAKNLMLFRDPLYQWPQSTLDFTLFFPNSAGAETTTMQLLLWLVLGLVRAEICCSTKIRCLWLLDRSYLSAGLFLTPCHQSSSETTCTHVGTAACSQYMGNTSSPDVLWVLFGLIIRN